MLNFRIQLSSVTVNIILFIFWILLIEIAEQFNLLLPLYLYNDAMLSGLQHYEAKFKTHHIHSLCWSKFEDLFLNCSMQYLL